jgi:hypothetical protein
MISTVGADVLEETEKTIVQASASAHGRSSHSQAPALALYIFLVIIDSYTPHAFQWEQADPRRAGDNRWNPIAQALLEIKAALHITP